MSGRAAVALCALALLVSSCAAKTAQDPPPAKRVADLPAGIAPGDVVFFRTTTWRGTFVRALQTGTSGFAHVGIVVTAGADVRVAHACPTTPAVVRIERLADLLQREEITGVAVYRPRVRRVEAIRAAAIASEYARRRTPFDFDFDLSTDRAVYCTELIWLCYRAAGLDAHARSRILFPRDLVRSGFLAPLGT